MQLRAVMSRGDSIQPGSRHDMESVKEMITVSISEWRRKQQRHYRIYFEIEMHRLRQRTPPTETSIK